MMIPHTIKHRSGSRRGFSLVEVALALAVISVSLLAVVGLMPSLLDTERENGFRSMLPKLRAQALAELRAKPYPSTFPHNQDILFTSTGEVTTEIAKATYKCKVLLAVPPASTSSSTGGIPEFTTDFCVVRLTCSVLSRPADTPVEFHESLAKER
jgi:uncharacterized protein (TIGR02598 family)